MAQKSDVCDLCEKENDVDWYCINCEEVLCVDCMFIHTKTKKTKADKIVSLCDARKDNLTKMSITLCSKHTTEQLKHFCESCEMLVCVACISETHKMHDWTPLEEYNESTREELKGVFKTLSDQLAAYQKAGNNEEEEHKQRIQSIKAMEQNVKWQTVKAFNLIYAVRNRQLSELTAWKENEKDKNTDTLAELNRCCSKIGILLGRIDADADQQNVLSRTQLLKDSKEAILRFTEPSPRNVNIPEFQEGSLSIKTLLHIQGTLSFHSEKAAEFEPIGITNIDNVNITSVIDVAASERICVIIPVDKDKLWIALAADRCLKLIDKKGKIIQKSVDVKGNIADAKMYRNGFLLVCHDGYRVIKLSLDAKTKSTFANVHPLCTKGLCITEDGYVLVCLMVAGSIKQNYSNEAKIVKLDRTGHVIQTFQKDEEGFLFEQPVSVTSLPSGEIFVVDRGSTFNVVCIDKQGHRQWTWCGDIGGDKVKNFFPLLITHDSYSRIYITDYNDRVFAIQIDGTKRLLDQSKSISKPWGIAINKDGLIVVGAAGGKIYIIGER